MIQKMKRWLSMFLVAVMLVAMIPSNSVYADAETKEITTEMSFDEKQKELAEENVEDTIGMPGEKDSKEASEPMVEMDIATNIKDNSEADTVVNADTSKESVIEENTETEVTTQAVTGKQEEITTEITTSEAISTEAMTEAEQIEESQGNIEESTPVAPVFQSIRQKMSKKVKASDQAPLGVILSAGAWGNGHYKWYVNTGDLTRHYIFCMEKGKAMSSGVFKPSRYSGTWGTKENTFRIAVAMDYFKKQGGWGSETGYVDTQYAIWNQGGTEMATKLITYSDYLWKLTELNENRESAADSYSDVITAIKESDANSKESRGNINANVKKVSRKGKDGYDVCANIKIKGSAWKYFAGKSEFGSLSVEGCYQADGKKLAGNVAKAALDSNGNLTVHTMQTNGSEEIATSKSNAVLVIMKVNPTYSGSTEIEYLQTAYNKKTQTLSYDANFHSPAYFAIKIYASQEDTPEPTGIQVNKVDEYGQEAEGAIFELYGTDSTLNAIAPKSIPGGEYVELNKAGNYTLIEAQAPAGMKLYTNSTGYHVVATFHVEERTVDGEKQLYVVPDITYENVVAMPDSNGMAYSYTVQDQYKDGDAVLHKIGNVFVAFENGQFVYKKRDLEHVTFELHAANDIYAQDVCLFEANQLITNDVLNASVWNQVGRHDARIEEETDENGCIHYQNLPYGKYYLIEKKTPYNGYWISGERLYFTIREKEEDTPTVIHQGEGYVNSPVPARCMVVKEDAENKRLSGAEFTLYAHISNTNFLGENLFTVDQTMPVVVSRENGVEKKVANQWIPIETMISNEEGEAYFDMELPYGRYLVAETNPPQNPENGKSYAVATESYMFEHTSEHMDAFSSGALFRHTFMDEKKGSFILIRKTGELLSDAITQETEYGTYRKLVFASLSAKDVTFEIRDIAGDLVEELTTNEYGEARSSDLKPGTYYVKEIHNGGSLRMESEAKEVVIKENDQQRVQIEELDFTNEMLNTQFQIYKQAEQVKTSEKVPVSGGSQEDSLYEYTLASIAGVVFGIFTKQDIKNVDGTVVVKAGSCMGYCVTDAEGISTFSEPLVAGEYYYKEIRAADDSYILDETEYGFTVTLNGEDVKKELNKEQPVVNVKYKGSIKVIKTDSVSKQVLPGVEFCLYDGDRKLLGTFVTDENGEITIRNVPLGIYYMQETRTLNGYILDTSMQEIILEKGYYNRELRLSNRKEEITTTEEETQEESDTIVSKVVHQSKKAVQTDKQAKTGDCVTGFITFLLCVAGLFLIMLCKRKEIWHYMKKIRNLFMLMLLGILFFLPAQSVKAHTNENTIVTVKDTTVMLDGKRVFGTVTFEEQGEGYQMHLTCGNQEYVSSRYYHVIEKHIGDDQVAYEFRLSDRSQNEEGYFTLVNVLGGRQITAPNEIKVVCSMLYEKIYTDGKEAYSMNMSEEGKVKKICWYDNLNLQIPVNSNVEEIIKKDDRQKVAVEDLRMVHLTCYKKDVTWKLGSIDTSSMPRSRFDQLQNDVQNNIIVRYGSDLAKAFSVTIHLEAEIQGTGTVVLKPGYITGNIHYTLNGGTMTAGTEEAAYVMGKELVLEHPKRKDYRFDGWYYDSKLTDNQKLSVNTSGNYYIPAERTQEDTLIIYAKWSYYVVVERDGLTYQIMPDHTAAVVANKNELEVVVAEKISYGGVEYPVTSIGNGAFANATIYKVTIPESIHEIAADAFSGCVNLKQVYMDGMNLTLGDVFDKAVCLYAYAESDAYKQYEQEGYTGEKTAYASNITYVLNDGMNADGNPEQYTWKSNLVLEPALREGYRFDGWYKDSAFQPGALIERICEDTYQDVVLYAKFTPLYSEAVASEEIPGPNREQQDTASVQTGQNTQAATVVQAQPEEKLSVTTQKRIVKKSSSIAKPRIRKVQFNVKKGKKVKVSIVANMAKGYCMEYATNKKLKRRNIIYISKNKHTFTKWKKDKTYYIRICAYNYDSEGKRIYGDWTQIYKLKMGQ